MTDEELSKLEYCSKITGKTKSEIIIDGINRVFDDLQGEKK